MKVTERTRDALRCRRERRRLKAAGFEEVGERGGNLWQLHRGYRQDHVIVDVRIAPEGKSLFIKTVPVPRNVPKSRNVHVAQVATKPKSLDFTKAFARITTIWET